MLIATTAIAEAPGQNLVYEVDNVNPLELPFISIVREPVKIDVNKNLINQLLEQYDWDATTAYRVMLAESGGNPEAVNATDIHKGCVGSFGLFQLACLYGTKEELFNPVRNIDEAYRLWKRSGWKNWTVCLKGIVKCL